MLNITEPAPVDRPSPARWGAPAGVQALAQALMPPSQAGDIERATAVWLTVADWASRHTRVPLVPLPEVRQLLALGAALPQDFGPLLQTAAPVAATPGARVRRSFEATTPLIRADGSLAAAASLADDRGQWAIGAPQMKIDTPLPPLLSAEGKLWRGRLSKRTDLLMPLRAGLATHETIEITAEGHDGPDGSGWRRYEHFLHECTEGPGLLTLLEDSGWIELRGSANRLVLRIHKRVTVLVPEELDRKFGAALPLALQTLLWFWADGFLKAVVPPDSPPQASKVQGPPAPPPEPKAVPTRDDGQGGRVARVAVLGGGPAGLACAWLLSNPNGTLWTAPPGLSLEFTLLEKGENLGGKAASTRHNTPGDTRIDEHGLHVLMGCYRNLRAMLAHAGAGGGLVPRSGTRVPSQAGGGADDGVTVDLGPWTEEPPPQPLAQWLQGDYGLVEDLSSLRLGIDVNRLLHLWQLPPDERLDELPVFDRVLYDLGHARMRPRPLLRVAAGLWSHVAQLKPPSPAETVGPATLQRLGLQLAFQRLAWHELAAQAHVDDVQPLEVPEPLADLAGLLRTLARAALPADSPDADVRLAGDAIELATSVMIGLDRAGLFPGWAIGRIDETLGDDYTAWARAVQGLDGQTLEAFLVDAGCADGYPARSRLLDALTAGLFTTPAGIAAGTFVHGLVRLFLTYRDSPYLMLQGGTGEAVIAPLAAALPAPSVQRNREVTAIALTADGHVASVTTTRADQRGVDPQTLDVDAAVLAIPPFGGTLERLGLPAALTQALEPIRHVATLSIQHWTQQAPRFPDLIVSGLGAPMRCAASMDHLQGHEGAQVPQAPVYYCGEAGEALAADWAQAPLQRCQAWLNQHAAAFQLGAAIPDPTVRVHRLGSDRYVMADPTTQAARRLVWQTGVPNLWLAGDWTRNTFSCGAIEGAVTSGLEAARHLLWQLGCKVHFPISGPMFDEDSA